MEDGKNCYILNFDCNNVNEIAKKIANIPKSKVKLPEDIYGKLLYKSKSAYVNELNSRYLVEATNKYTETNTSDNGLCQMFNKSRYIPEKGFQWIVNYLRMKKLLACGFVKVIKKINEEVDENCIIESKKTKKKN